MSVEYSPGQVSKLLDIPGATLRRYVNLFGGYLSSEANRKRGRSFTEQDIGILSHIRTLSQQGVPLNMIGDKLGDVFEYQVPDQEPPSQTTYAIMTRIGERVASIDQRLDNTDANLADIRQRLERIERPGLLARIWRALFGG